MNNQAMYFYLPADTTHRGFSIVRQPCEYHKQLQTYTRDYVHSHSFCQMVDNKRNNPRYNEAPGKKGERIFSAYLSDHNGNRGDAGIIKQEQYHERICRGGRERLPYGLSQGIRIVRSPYFEGGYTESGYGEKRFLHALKKPLSLLPQKLRQVPLSGRVFHLGSLVYYRHRAQHNLSCHKGRYKGGCGSPVFKPDGFE